MAHINIGTMAFAIFVTALNLFLIVAIIAAVIWFQVKLSRKKSRWPGLIMPILSFLFSLLIVLGMVAFDTVSPDRAQVLQAVGQTVLALLVYNIPTALFAGIYCFARQKLRQDELLKKMNIQDL